MIMVGVNMGAAALKAEEETLLLIDTVTGADGEA